MKTCKVLALALGASFEELWQTAFTARLRKWLKREGYRRMPKHELLEICKRIEIASR